MNSVCTKIKPYFRSSHGDLYSAGQDSDNNLEQQADQQLSRPHNRFSMHNLHEANEMRASRADLRDARDMILHRNMTRESRRSLGGGHHLARDSSRRDSPSKRRSIDRRKLAELLMDVQDCMDAESDQEHGHQCKSCQKCAIRKRSPHHLPLPHTQVFGPGAFRY